MSGADHPAGDVAVTQAQVDAIDKALCSVHNSGATYTFEGVAAGARIQHRELLESLNDADLCSAVAALFHLHLKSGAIQIIPPGASGSLQ